MTLTKAQIKSAAMQLTPADRESLAEELLLSLGGDERDAIDAAWLAEARRRDADFLAGRTTARPVEQVLARLESKGRP